MLNNLSNLNSNLALNLAYLNLALNNSAQKTLLLLQEVFLSFGHKVFARVNSLRPHSECFSSRAM